MINNNKIISAILAMTIMSGLVTPVGAIEVTASDSIDEVFSLENTQLEKISDDTNILEDGVLEVQEAENDDTDIEEEVIYSEDLSAEEENELMAIL